MKTNRILKVNLSDIKRDYSSIARAIAMNYKVKTYSYVDLMNKLRNESYKIPTIIVDTRKKSK